MDPVTASLIQGGMSAVSGFASNIANNKAIEKQNARNWKNQVDMWNLNNAYNNPLEQRRRLEKAGYNPNLAVGSIQNTSQNQKMPEGQPQTYNQTSEGIQNAVTNFQNSMMQNSQILKNDAEITSKQSQTALTNEQRRQLEDNRDANIKLRSEQLKSQELQNAQKSIFNSGLDARLKSQLNESMARIQNLSAMNDKMAIEREILSIQREMWRNGVNPNTDGLLTRLLSQILPTEMLKDFGRIIDQQYNNIKTGVQMYNRFKP